MSPAIAETAMRTYLGEIVAQGRLALIDDLVAADFVDHTQPTLRGPAALEAHVRGFRERIPDVTLEIEQIIAVDDAVVGLWRWAGTPREPFGLSAGGNPVVPHEVASLFRLRDGLVVEYRVFADAVEILGQIADASS